MTSRDTAPPAATAGPFESRLASTLRAALAEATDGELRQVVGALDGLASRAGADDLLSGLRPRIGQLRPTRPLRFSRLLALPLEPVLVTTPAWHRDRLGVPRAALAILIEAMRHALGAEAGRIEAAAQGHTMGDAVLVAILGRRLWPRAAEAPLPLPPSGWVEARLPPEAAEPVMALCRIRWREAALDQPGG
jgi:hypothetical protein